MTTQQPPCPATSPSCAHQCAGCMAGMHFDAVCERWFGVVAS